MNAVKITSAVIGRAGICVCVTFTDCQRKIFFFANIFLCLPSGSLLTFFLHYITQASSDRSSVSFVGLNGLLCLFTPDLLV